jgi:hypothetical protein
VTGQGRSWTTPCNCAVSLAENNGDPANLGEFVNNFFQLKRGSERGQEAVVVSCHETKAMRKPLRTGGKEIEGGNGRAVNAAVMGGVIRC